MKETPESNLFFQRDGKPYGGEFRKRSLQWAEDIGNPDLKFVKETELPNGKFVSTIWTGIDRSRGWMEDAPRPMIFETAVFERKNNFTELVTDHYSTEAEAIDGHEQLCDQWSRSE